MVRGISHLTACVLLTMAFALPHLAAHAGDIAPPVSDRFAAPEEMGETPDFQRHVLPLLGRLGCNGRDCHGSFQGQGGFRLSLFGYDFAADHAALTGGDEPRADPAHVTDSLILRKPTMLLDHDGGQRFDVGGWEFELLRRWVAAGAEGIGEQHTDLLRLEVVPPEIVFATLEEATPLKVIAHWADGQQEDVTPLCRFQSNDGAIAEVDPHGVVRASGRGDTHIVAFYDNGIAAVPVVLPVSELTGNDYPPTPAPTEIDRLVLAKLRKVGMVPAELCTDAEFLRRVSLDMTGTPPAADEIRDFLADASSDKRARKVEELLNRPSYAAWMTTRLCDWTGNAEENLPVGGEQGVRREKSSQWYDWIYRRVEQNMPYDQIVEGMVMAIGRREGQSDDEYFAEMTSYFQQENPGDFSARPDMPYFWTRGRFSPPQTLRFSYAFLGVRLECAECHKHPYDQWTQEDYQDFKIFFDQVQFRQSGHRGRAEELKQALGLTADQDSGGYKRLFAKLAYEGTVVPWGEVVAPNWQKSRNPLRGAKTSSGRVITPRVLGGEEVIAQEYTDPREPVMQWLRGAENPYFARTLVNRIWAGYFGVGIVDPPDDMNLANPAANEPLLAWLAEEFVAQGYDLKWLHRTIVSSDAYQRSWRPNDTNAFDRRNFSRAHVRRLPAEVAYDSLVFATASAAEQSRMRADPAKVRSRQIGFPETGRNAEGSYAMELFGKPAREQVCDCQRSSEPSLLQTVYLRNDADLRRLLDRPEGWLAELKAGDNALLEEQHDKLVAEAWLRAWGRLPDEAELQVGKQHLIEADHAAEGLADLMWALLNAKEFILNH